MGDKTKIEWTRGDDGTAGATWNPVTGCTKVSPGCDNCYAERIVERFHGKGSFALVQRSDDKLYLPFRWRRPRRVFVNSMSDLFHDDVPTSFIANVWSVMARTPQHTYQVLTKRHGRMRSLLNSAEFYEQVRSIAPGARWPLSNVWLGVSVESQQWADIRIPALWSTSAAVRWLSVEPLLGPVSLRLGQYSMPPDGEFYSTTLDGIDWVVLGGESGPGARPMHPDWARFIRDQCASAGVPFFYKQAGQWSPVVDEPRHRDVWVGRDGTSRPYEHGDGMTKRGLDPWTDGDAILMRRARSKHDVGRELDGRAHDEYPTAVGQLATAST